MPFSLLADAVVLVHLAFVLFVILGGLLVVRSPRVVWLHAPAVMWAVLLELCGWTCPLTPLENALRQHGGSAGYSGGFVEHYIVPIVYPADLTRELQLYAGLGVLVLNSVIYWCVVRR